MKSNTLKLLKKELCLGNASQTVIWTICCFGMYFIPSYPMYVGPFYMTLCIMMTFALNQSSHDILYTALLPVKKIDVVKARFMYCGMMELFAFICALLGWCIRSAAGFPANTAGIELTLAYFGFQMIIFAIFNLIFLGNVYKDPLKPGLRYIAAAVAYFICYAACELPVWAYYANAENSLAKVGELFTSRDTQFIIPQLIILAAGIVIYAVSWCLTFRRAARQFEKYDL